MVHQEKLSVYVLLPKTYIIFILGTRFFFLFGSLGVRSCDMYKSVYRELLSWADLVYGIIWVASKCLYN